MVVVSLVLTVCAKYFRVALQESSRTLSGISNVCPYQVRMSYLIRLSMLLMYNEKKKELFINNNPASPATKSNVQSQQILWGSSVL